MRSGPASPDRKAKDSGDGAVSAGVGVKKTRPGGRGLATLRPLRYSVSTRTIVGSGATIVRTISRSLTG